MIQDLDKNVNPTPPLAKEPEAVEVFPYGISVGPEISRPVLIFHDESEQLRVPIWLGPLEAATAVAYLDYQGSGYTPLGVLTQVLEQLQVRVEKCVFDQVQGHRQSGVLYFQGLQAMAPIRRSADEVVTVGLTQKARFYATAEFSQRSREMKMEIREVEAHLKAFPDEGRKSHRFLM